MGKVEMVLREGGPVELRAEVPYGLTQTGQGRRETRESPAEPDTYRAEVGRCDVEVYVGGALIGRLTGVNPRDLWDEDQLGEAIEADAGMGAPCDRYPFGAGVEDVAFVGGAK